MKEKEVAEMLFPSEFETPGSRAYFSKVKLAALETGLIDYKSEGGVFVYVGDERHVDSLESFRKYCNSYIWSKYKNETFCKLTEVVLGFNADFISKSVTDVSTISYVRKKMPNASSSLNDEMLALRFWLSFLGFGFVTSKTQFYPNMYLALKDFVSLCDFQKNKLISISDFLNKIGKYFDIGILEMKEKYKINYALSTALWTMSANKEIELRRESDSKENWRLFFSKDSNNKQEITHVVLKGGNIND